MLLFQVGIPPLLPGPFRVALPRSYTKPIAKLIDEGKDVQALVPEADPSAFTDSVKTEVFYLKA